MRSPCDTPDTAPGLRALNPWRWLIALFRVRKQLVPPELVEADGVQDVLQHARSLRLTRRIHPRRCIVKYAENLSGATSSCFLNH